MEMCAQGDREVFWVSDNRTLAASESVEKLAPMQTPALKACVPL